MNRNVLLLLGAVLALVPAVFVRLVLGAHVDESAGAIVWPGGSMSAPVATAIFGLAILAAAFLISWAAELLQLDVSQNLATALVALLAVLPEYSVDVYLAWTAAVVPENHGLALANMTGANRLLIGIGWPAIAIAVLWRWRKRETLLETSRWGEVFILGVATVYSFVLPLKGSLSLIDTVIFFAMFVFYLRYVIRQQVIEPELGGPAELIAHLPKGWRRFSVYFMFALAGLALFLSAEPFAEGLKMTGHSYGINEFLLIQWLAPLASEAPEFIIALIFALRGMASAGFGTLVSSKVNQWTLLVGMVPLAYAAGLWYNGKPIEVMTLDTRQFGELLLTSAQSVFAVLIVIDRRFKFREAMMLLVLFLAQFVISVGIEEFARPELRENLGALEKYFFSVVYIALTINAILRHRRDIRALAHYTFTGREEPIHAGKDA